MPGPYFPGYVTKGDYSKISATVEHELGTWGYGESGKILQYVKFCASYGSIKKYNWVALSTVATGADAANTIMMLLNQSTHMPMGVAEYGGTAGSYGWITRYGPATAQTSATLAAQGCPLGNDAQATGTLGTSAFSATFGGLARGSGILVGTPSVTGTYVNVRCL